MTKDNGGPAFPTTAGQVVYSNGMSLRDWFAGQALAGAFSTMAEVPRGEEMFDTMARDCYAVAAAMLAARKDTPDEH